MEQQKHKKCEKHLDPANTCRFGGTYINSETEDEDIDGFVEEERTEKVSVLFSILCVSTEQC